MTGDGTTSNVLFTGELLAQAERYIQEGAHPRIIVEVNTPDIHNRKQTYNTVKQITHSSKCSPRLLD